MSGITVDNINYNVRAVFDTMTRSFELVEGPNGGTSISGRTIRDVLGTAYEYEMQVEPVPGQETAYDSFYQKITEPVDYHTVVLPYGQTTISFQAQIISGSDTYSGISGSKNKWRQLTVTFVPIEPQRV